MAKLSSSAHDIRQRASARRRHVLMLGCSTLMALPCCSLWHAIAPSPAQSQAANAVFVEPAGPEETSQNEEAGVAHLHALLRCVDASITQLQFQAAEDCLSHAERGAARANSLTRSHPDFDDMLDAIKAARPKLTSAIERDRIAKRNQAIDALIARGEVAYDHANTLCMAQARQSPSADDIAELTDSLTALHGLLRSGEGFVDAQRYKAHAEQLKAALSAVTTLRDTMSWQLNTLAQLSPLIDAGFAAATQAKASGEAPKQLAAYKDVAQTFAQCTQIVQAATQAPAAEPNLIFETRFGSLTLLATGAQCTQVLAQASERVARFGWEHLIAQLADVLPKVQAKGQKAAEALAQALPLLNACADGAPSISDAAQSESWTFKTPLGTLRTDALRRACAKEAVRLAPKQASLAWQTRLEAVGARMAAAQESLAAASARPVPIDAVPRLAQAKGSFEECFEASGALAREPAADRTFKVSLQAGDANVDAITKRCMQGAKDSERALKQAAAEAATRQFAAGCRGDERSVVEREGAPQTVQAVGTGRIFVYGPHKRIAFDSAGRRTQESALTP